MITVAYYITTAQKKRAIYACIREKFFFIIFPDKDANESHPTKGGFRWRDLKIQIEF